MTLFAQPGRTTAFQDSADTPAGIRMLAQRIRDSASERTPREVATALAQTFARWRQRGMPQRCAVVSRIAEAAGLSRELLDESIDALLAPFTAGALEAFAESVCVRNRVGAFILPANVPGAGMHELCAALIAGSGAIVKTSIREPFFFPAFARTLAEVDPALAQRLAVLAFGRERTDLGSALTRSCDYAVALGEDETIGQLGGGARMFGFGSRASGAMVSAVQPVNAGAVAGALARDVTLFEQQGCLSPHHVFVESRGGGDARALAFAIASALESLARGLPPARLSFHNAAAIRRFRESARWRRIGGRPVELWEGAGMSWTVAFDPDARFTVGPGFRSLVVTPVADRADFESRLAPIAGRLEGFALAVPALQRAQWVEALARAGVCYICDPGRMQSPPVTWPHGGAAFLDFISGMR